MPNGATFTAEKLSTRTGSKSGQACQSYVNMVRCIDTPPCFFRHFPKGNNFRDFLLAFLAVIALPNWSLLFKGRICSKRSKFLSLRANPFSEGKQINS